MNPAIEQLRQERKHKAELDAQAMQSQQIIDGLAKLDQTQVQAFSALINYMQGATTKTEVVNQLRSINTPDSLKVMSAVNDMHSTLKKKNVDLAPVAQMLGAILDQVSQLPKELPELPEQRESVAISNLSSLEDKFDGLEDAIQALASKELPKPEVNVSAPEVTVQPTDVQVDVDLKPIQKGLQEAVKAFKSIVIPPQIQTDVSGVEKELKKSNKLLKEITQKPMGGGGGSGGHTTPYIDSNGKPVYVEQSLDLQVDDTGTYTYLGNATPGTATSATGWRIKRVVNASGVITHADGVSTFTKSWSDRATYNY